MRNVIIMAALVFFSLPAYANDRQVAKEICQGVADNTVSFLITKKAGNELGVSNSDKKEALSIVLRQHKAIQEPLKNTLDEIYKTPLSIASSDYFDKVVRIQDKFTDSCVKVVSDYVEQEKQQARKTVITVQVDTEKYVKNSPSRQLMV